MRKYANDPSATNAERNSITSSSLSSRCLFGSSPQSIMRNMPGVQIPRSARYTMYFIYFAYLSLTANTACMASILCSTGINLYACKSMASSGA